MAYSRARVVQLCRRKSDRALVIIKEIPVEEMTREERMAALNEVKVCARTWLMLARACSLAAQVLDMLHHPNIIAYYDSFVADKALMIVMEYADGGTVFEFLQAREVRVCCIVAAE